jgi:hypothetical protein
VDPLSSAPAGVMQEWNPTTRRFEAVRGAADLEELEARKQQRRQETRARKLEKSDAMARDFLQLPPRHVEEMRAKIPEEVVERVRKMTLKFDGELLTVFAKGYQRQYKQKLSEVAAEVGLPGTSHLLKLLKDIVVLRKKDGELRVHYRYPDSVREKQIRRANAKRDLLAMKARDFTEKDGLRVVKDKLARVESKVIRKFRQGLTPREKELLESKVPELQERARSEREGKIRETRDPLLRDMYSQLAKTAAAAPSGDALESYSDEGEGEGQKVEEDVRRREEGGGKEAGLKRSEATQRKPDMLPGKRGARQRLEEEEEDDEEDEGEDEEGSGGSTDDDDDSSDGSYSGRSSAPGSA